MQQGDGQLIEAVTDLLQRGEEGLSLKIREAAFAGTHPGRRLSSTKQDGDGAAAHGNTALSQIRNSREVPVNETTFIGILVVMEGDMPSSFLSPKSGRFYRVSPTMTP